jgi:hypothetical protein
VGNPIISRRRVSGSDVVTPGSLNSNDNSKNLRIISSPPGYYAPTLWVLGGLTFCQQLKNEGRPRFPLSFVTPQSRLDLPPIIAPGGRFGAMEFQRAKRRLQKAMVEHYK